MNAPTVYDVARLAGVSTATVSRCFRDPQRVREATREKVRDAVERLGYIPSGSAQGLAERQTGVIGLYSFSGHEPDELELPELSDPGRVVTVRERSRPRLYPLFADEVLRGVELECTLRGRPLAFGGQHATSGGVPLDEITRRVDGLLVLPDIVEPAQLRLLTRQRQVVTVSHRARRTSAGSVTVANAAGMHALLSHLATVHGARTIWYAGHHQGFDAGARWDAVAEGAPSVGMSIDGPPIPTTSRADTRAAVAERLGTPLPDAIVCTSDQAALGAMEALLDAGIGVPDQVAVTGFDGIDAGAFSAPTLTTVRQPMVALGRLGVEQLIDQLAGGEPRDTVLPVELVLRRSCGCT